MADEPDSHLAARVLPQPLYVALCHVFGQGLADSMLVGGTALSGYYAGHRRSDDLDIFVRDDSAHRAAVLAVESLTSLGATVRVRQRTPQFFDATCALSSHVFTAQVVIDARLFSVGRAARAADGVSVATLPTLFAQKAATLLSRCSEKDLYDLAWLFGRSPETPLAALVTKGAEIDAGMTAESVLLSLTGAPLRASACDFSLTHPPEVVFATITELRQALAQQLDRLARRQAVGPVGELVHLLRR